MQKVRKNPHVIDMLRHNYYYYYGISNDKMCYINCCLSSHTPHSLSAGSKQASLSRGGVGFILGYGRRRWSNVKPTSGRHRVFVGRVCLSPVGG